MPLQQDIVQPIGVTFTFKDLDANLGKTTMYFDPNIALATLLTHVGTIEAALNVISGAPIQSASINLPLTPNPTPSAPSETTDVERKGTFTFDTANPASQSKIEVPSVSNGVVVNGSDIIDPAVAAAFATALINAGVVNGIGAPLTTLRSAYKRHRRSSRG